MSYSMTKLLYGKPKLFKIMTEEKQLLIEEKQMLIIDICAKLPYGLKATTKSGCWPDAYYVEGYKNNRIYLDCPVYGDGDDEWLVESVIPYLRPMSSMTEEEKQWSRWYQRDVKSDNFILYMNLYAEWLDSNHFDWRTDGNGKTLIEKGLALEAPEGMY